MIPASEADQQAPVCLLHLNGKHGRQQSKGEVVASGA